MRTEPNDSRDVTVPKTTPPLESAMRTGQGDEDADEALTIGEKLPEETGERHDEAAVADAAEALGAPPRDEA